MSDISGSVLRKPLSPNRMRECLEQIVAGWYSASNSLSRKEKIRRNSFRAAIGRFMSFVATKGYAEVGIDEAMMDEYWQFLVEEKTPESHIRTTFSEVRKVINALPSEVRQRVLRTRAEQRGLSLLDGLSDKTQKGIERFLLDGRRFKSVKGVMTPSPVLLKAEYRRKIVTVFRQFMDEIGKTDVSQVTEEDRDSYLDAYSNGGRQNSGLGNLHYIRPLFRNLIKWGYASLDPVDGISKREWRENLDYVDSEGIETLRTMSTVNMDDFYDVRDRLLCFGFCYDFALRIGEASLLRCTDVVINDMVELTLRGETQKGRKPDILMFNFFAETKTLLSQYLTLRTRLGAGTDMLFVSMSGEPLRAGGCYEAVRAHCKNLGILTHEGHPVAPHRLRHSFGTLNVAPLGANLDVYSIMQRLRHASYDVTTRIYITSNPLLSRARHEQACRRMNSGNSVISQTVVSPVQPVLQAHVAGGVGEVGGDKIREVEALRDVKKLGITVEGLRKYAAEKKYAVKVSGEWFYQASWIAELRSEYTVKAAAIAATGLSRAGYAKWVATRGLSTLVIGKASLIRSSDLLREMASLRKGKGDGMGKGKSKSK